MNIITGGTGHVGSALAEALIRKGQQVTIISRSSERAKEWAGKGALVAVADIYDTPALHDVFKKGRSVFLLNPPADPMTDTVVEERKTIVSLVEALKNSGIKHVVIESTMGAQAGENIGDLGVLYELEQAVAKLYFSYNIIRPAYYMSNWDSVLKTVNEKPEILSFFPADFSLPMVAPIDIGEFASELMTETGHPVLSTIQGPDSYTPAEVAAAFASALQRDISVKVVPEDQWEATFRSVGFSEAAARSYSRMTAVTLKSDIKVEGKIIRGKTTLQEYIHDLVKNAGTKKE